MPSLPIDDNYIKIILGMGIVLALMWLLSLVLKKINDHHSGLHGKTNRLKIMEQRMIDSKTKLAIIRCDDTEHLVLLSPDGPIVIKNDLPSTPKETSSISMTAHNKKDIPVESD